jgi:hypothetical protein
MDESFFRAPQRKRGPLGGLSDAHREFELVHTMEDYYDGPRRGIANFRGEPHLYESERDSALGNYSEVFRLSPVAPAVLEAALEDWAIWRRWEQAFHDGRVPQSTHPALPEDRARHEELARYLKANLRIDPKSFVRAVGEFHEVEQVEPGYAGWMPLRVRWSLVGPAA